MSHRIARRLNVSVATTVAAIRSQDVRLAQMPQQFGGRDVPQRPDEERDGDEDADEDCETASHPRASRTSSDISSTARSIPTSTERLTIEWPMFSSSHSAIAATGCTFS